MELLCLAWAASSHMALERKGNKQPSLSHHHRKRFCLMPSTLMPTGHEPTVVTCPCLAFPLLQSRRCLHREQPPPLTRVYLNPAHPLEDGSNPTSHETALPLPLGHLACAAFTAIHHRAQDPTVTGPRGVRDEVMINISLH